MLQKKQEAQLTLE